MNLKKHWSWKKNDSHKRRDDEKRLKRIRDVFSLWVLSTTSVSIKRCLLIIPKSSLPSFTFVPASLQNCSKYYALLAGFCSFLFWFLLLRSNSCLISFYLLPYRIAVNIMLFWLVFVLSYFGFCFFEVTHVSSLTRDVHSDAMLHLMAAFENEYGNRWSSGKGDGKTIAAVRGEKEKNWNQRSGIEWDDYGCCWLLSLLLLAELCFWMNLAYSVISCRILLQWISSWRIRDDRREREMKSLAINQDDEMNLWGKTYSISKHESCTQTSNLPSLLLLLLHLYL